MLIKKKRISLSLAPDIDDDLYALVNNPRFSIQNAIDKVVEFTKTNKSDPIYVVRCEHLTMNNRYVFKVSIKESDMKKYPILCNSNYLKNTMRSLFDTSPFNEKPKKRGLRDSQFEAILDAIADLKRNGVIIGAEQTETNIQEPEKAMESIVDEPPTKEEVKKVIETIQDVTHEIAEDEDAEEGFDLLSAFESLM